MEKFYQYLTDKNKVFLTKKDIENQYKDFQKLWNIDKPFTKAFDSLRKTKLTYIFEDNWALKKGDIVKLFQEFLTQNNIPNYYGLETALYLNQIIWQPPVTFYLLNTKYTKIRKNEGIVIKLIKIPKRIYNKETLLQKELVFSDYEKTILDMKYFKKQTTYEPKNIDKYELYKGLYKKR